MGIEVSQQGIRFVSGVNVPYTLLSAQQNGRNNEYRYS
jgi:hypothetical protein